MNYQTYQQQQQQAAAAAAGQQPITQPTTRDVLNGRGQGVQRHPGNVKYRTLVFVNKGLYAKCPRTDKMKISKGIVAAVRELGGRFLELDERTSIYHDIGDKKATEKTSQALREGQTKIRKQMYKDEQMGGSPYDTSLLGNNGNGSGGVPMPSQREISAEGYFGYSVQVLESLYNEESGADPNAVPPPGQQTIAAAAVHSNPAAAQHVHFDNDALARAREQFGGGIPAAQAPPPLPPVNEPGGIGRFTDANVRITESGMPSPSRLTRDTNMSMASMFSIGSLRNLLESARHEDAGMGGRGTLQSVLSSEIRDLIRLSEPQLNLAMDMNLDMDMDDMEDKEVLFDEDTMKDRVSELRFTDLSRDGAVRYNSSEADPRLTESSESTDYSGQKSLMDASIMSFDRTTVHENSEKPAAPGRNDSGDRADAELLMRLSTDNHGQV